MCPGPLSRQVRDAGAGRSLPTRDMHSGRCPAEAEGDVWGWGSECGLSAQHAGTLCLWLPREAGWGGTLRGCQARTGSPTSKESWFPEGRAGEE